MGKRAPGGGAKKGKAKGRGGKAMSRVSRTKAAKRRAPPVKRSTTRKGTRRPTRKKVK